MEKLINEIKKEVTEAFVKAGYDEKYGMVSVSNRPDLCQYQCNGAMAAAKQYKKAPIMIAKEVVALLENSDTFETITAIAPGFINITLNGTFLAKYVSDMAASEKYGVEEARIPRPLL